MVYTGDQSPISEGQTGILYGNYIDGDFAFTGAVQAADPNAVIAQLQSNPPGWTDGTSPFTKPFGDRGELPKPTLKCKKTNHPFIHSQPEIVV